MEILGQLGMALAFGLGATGSALGVGAAGRAAAGAWAKEAREGKRLNFIYIILVGLPISQTIYGFLLMRQMVGLSAAAVGAHAGLLMSLGVAGGLAELFSAVVQGAIGAAAVRALSEGENKGFAFMIIAMGIAETVGLFGFVFALLVMGGLAG